jgi:phage tail-like protein
MPGRNVEPLLGTSHFRVLIGKREVGFSEVGSVTSRTDLTLPADARHAFESVVLRRALTGSTELYDWRRAIVAGKDDRRPVTIQLLDGPGGNVAGSWQLVDAWPSRWSGPVLNALESGIAYEELELTFDDVIWTTPDTTSQGG